MDGLSVRDAALELGIGEHPAIIEQGQVVSYAALASRVEQRQAELVARGVRPGSRVTMRATCELDTIVTFFALLEVGAAFVPIHPRLTIEEERAIIEDVQPHVRLSGANIEAGLSDVAGEIVVEDPVVAIVYTSGTTGKPKGAVLSRSSFVASARASEANLGWKTNDRWLVCMPLAHVGGLSILTRCLLARKTIVLEPRFDAAAVLRCIRKEAITQISVVPTMLHALLEADCEGDLRRLRFLLVGGAAASPRLLEQAAERGLLAITTYGLTEACSQVTCQPLRASGSVEPGSGRVLPGLDLRIAREDGGPANVDEVGFVHVRGPNLMRGYWMGLDKPLATPWTNDGWFVTGDMGALDATGRLFIHARRTDLIVTGGENVYPVEVEQIIERCAEIAEAVVFGVPDERWGQTVGVALVLSDGLFSEDRALKALSRAADYLAPHKRPRHFAILAVLPRNPTGKIDRAAVCREAIPKLLRVTVT